ncbi:hypothetical protein HYT01_01860 [Candidatus Giovannonibacteria bacterium]|nr:hypothetical protein [Candidatus Giovannonibacteria bacterium]
MNQLGDSLEAEGFATSDVTQLTQYSNIAGIKAVLNGSAKIVPISEDTSRFITLNETTIAVNLAAAPKLPFNGAEVEQNVGEGWAILEKRTEGLYVNGEKMVLYLSKRQKNGKQLKGFELREELTGKPVLNASVLDALLANTHLIPEDWKRDENGNAIYIFFWASIFRGLGGCFCVRCLCFCGVRWYSHYDWLNYGWYGDVPAALRAS